MAIQCNHRNCFFSFFLFFCALSMLIRNQAEMPSSGKILKDRDKAIYIYVLFCNNLLVFYNMYRIFGLPFRKAIYKSSVCLHWVLSLQLSGHKRRNVQSTPQCWCKKQEITGLILSRLTYPFNVWYFPVGVVLVVISRITFTRRNVNILVMHKVRPRPRRAFKSWMFINQLKNRFFLPR